MERLRRPNEDRWFAAFAVNSGRDLTFADRVPHFGRRSACEVEGR